MSTGEDDLHEIFETTTGRLIALYITSGVSILAGAVTVYGLVILWKLRSLPFIIKRHPSLVLATCISLIAILIIERPLSAFSRLDTFASLELSWTRWVLHLISSQTLFICVLFRIYITFFDVSFAKANAASLWVKYIDKHSKCKKSSCIVANYTKYGNLHRIYPYIICLIVTTLAIAITLSVVGNNIAFIFNAAALLFWWLIMCILWIMAPKYLDTFKIRVEVRMLLAIQSCLLITNAAYVIIASSQKSVSYGQWLVLHIITIIFISMLAYVQTIWVLKKFKIAVKKKLIREQEISATETYAHHKSIVAKYGSQAEELKEDLDQKLELELDIIDIISEAIGFEAFMSHLNKEFSMENLLALIEFNQYKERYREIRQVKKCIDEGVDPLSRKMSTKGSSKIITKIVTKMRKTLSVRASEAEDDEIGTDEDFEEETDAVEKDETAQEQETNENLPAETTQLNDRPSTIKRSGTLLNVTDQLVTLPDSIPLSNIVYGERYKAEEVVKNIEKIKKMVLKKEAIRIIKLLFAKYIEVGCEMELNLSHRLRRRCLNKLSRVNEMNDLQMEHMFDKCIVALLKLMQDSYSRFKETKDFIRYEEKAKKRMREKSLITNESLGGIFGDLM